MDEIEGPEWANSVEGLMDALGLNREDAQFMYDFERDKLGYDLSLTPRVMRLYKTDAYHARWMIAASAGRIPRAGSRLGEGLDVPTRSDNTPKPRGNR
jgi:hypothetical protein